MQWFDLVQSIGIVGGLTATCVNLVMERRSRKFANYLTIVGHHRELWSEVQRAPYLARVFKEDVDLESQPVTVAEQEFLNLVIVHYQTGWMAAQEDMFLTLHQLSLDARSFFSLPIPATVWNKTRQSRDPRFTDFIDRSVGTQRSSAIKEGAL